MNLTEWADELNYSLANGPGTPALLTVATCNTERAAVEVVVTARAIVQQAGWSASEVSARQFKPDEVLLKQILKRLEGYLILRDVDAPLGPSVPIVVAAHQHLIRDGAYAGLLVIGTAEGIGALIANPAMGFLGRAERLEMG